MQPARQARVVLVVDSDRALARLVQNHLAQHDPDQPGLNCVAAANGAEAIELVRQHRPSLLILDLDLPDMGGLELLEILKSRGQETPFIVVTRRRDHRSAVKLMKLGARDYLLKDESLVDLLPLAVTDVLEQTALQQAAPSCALPEPHPDMLQAVIDSLADPLYVMDAESLEVQLANLAARRSGRTALSLVLSGRGGAAPDTSPAESPIQEVKRTGHPVILEHVHYARAGQASVHEIRLHPVFDQTGQVRQLVEYDLDVTGRRRIEQALRDSEARLRQVVESLPIILTSRDGLTGRLLLKIGAVQEITGYEPQQFFEDPDLFIHSVHPDDRAAVIASLEQPPDQPYELEFRVCRADGRTVWTNVRAAPIRDEDGNLIRIDAILVDTTREKQLAQEREQFEHHLQQAQKLESLGVLAGGIAHDFSNLLTVIRGNVQFLRESWKPDAAQEKALGDIEAAARAATDMTRSLQAFSRPGKPHITRTDANALVQEVYRFLRRLIPARINFQFLPCRETCILAADPAQIQQVLINLCINARDAIKGQGCLEIRTRRLTSQQLPLRLRYDAASPEYVEICVRDDGCGMDASTLRKAFDPFFTTKPKDQGTGLGLAIVYRIVRAHDGLVEVDSAADKGSEFRVYFPHAGNQPQEPAPEPLEVHGTEHVLVVEDEEMIASLLKTLLESNGYQVTVAHRPERAMAIADAAIQPVNLAVIDYGLPGMGGDKCLQALRQRWPELKAILITGYAVDSGELGLPDVRLVQKPFSAKAIIEVVRETLDKK